MSERNDPRMEYPFPIEGWDQIAKLELPKYLTEEDADRLKAFIDTLVMEKVA